MTWGTAALRDVATIDRDNVAPNDIETGARYVGLEHIESGGGSLSFGTVSNGELASNKFRFGPHHILFGKLRPYLAKIVCPDFEGICSTDILPIAPRECLDQRYLLHFLRRPETVDWASSRATGVNLPRLGPQELASLQIPLPPLDEQRRIAAILDKADELRCKRRRAVGLLKSLARSMFQEMFGSLLDNPYQWKTANISGACEMIVDCVNRTAQVVEYETPYKMIRTTNVRDGKVDLTKVRYVAESTFEAWNRRAVPRDGDVLLTREAPVGGVGILKGSEQVFLGQRLMLYRTKEDCVTPDFLVWSFQDPYLQNQFDRMSSGSTVKHLPLPACRAFELRVPPISLQKEFSRRLAQLARVTDAVTAQEGALSKLFSSLQHRAFSGRL